jgi:hypothetical protein
MSTGFVSATLRAVIVLGVVMASTNLTQAVAEGRPNVILVHGA